MDLQPHRIRALGDVSSRLVPRRDAQFGSIRGQFVVTVRETRWQACGIGRTAGTSDTAIVRAVSGPRGSAEARSSARRSRLWSARASSKRRCIAGPTSRGKHGRRRSRSFITGGGKPASERDAPPHGSTARGKARAALLGRMAYLLDSAFGHRRLDRPLVEDTRPLLRSVVLWL